MYNLSFFGSPQYRSYVVYEPIDKVNETFNHVIAGRDLTNLPKFVELYKKAPQPLTQVFERFGLETVFLNKVVSRLMKELGVIPTFSVEPTEHPTQELLDQGTQLGIEIIRQSLGIRSLDSNEEATKVAKPVDDFIWGYLDDRVKLARSDDHPEELLMYNRQKGIYQAEETQKILSDFLFQLMASIGFGEELWSTTRNDVVIKNLVHKIPITPQEEFNREFYAFANKSLDLATGEFVDHDAAQLLTFGSDVVVDAEATCPKFEAFLSSLFGEDADGFKTIQFVQEWFAYTFSNSFKANALLIGLGSGSNGKSLLLSVLSSLIGTANTSSKPIDQLSTPFGLEPLLGKKLNVATESDADVVNSKVIKTLTAGEQVSVNRKNKRELAYVLPVKLVFLMNNLPLIADSSFGMERRVIVLPFTKTFKGKADDVKLSEKLHGELSGVLNWLIVGLKRLVSNQYCFTISNAMEQAKLKMFAHAHPIESFIKTCLIYTPDAKSKTSEIHNQFKSWAENREISVGTLTSAKVFWPSFDKVATELFKRPTDRHKVSGIMHLFNITLIDKDDDDGTENDTEGTNAVESN